jgi:hypothetical protein
MPNSWDLWMFIPPTYVLSYVLGLLSSVVTHPKIISNASFIGLVGKSTGNLDISWEMRYTMDFYGFLVGIVTDFPKKSARYTRLPIDPPIQLAFSNARRVFSREPLIFHEPAPCHAEKI